MLKIEVIAKTLTYQVRGIPLHLYLAGVKTLLEDFMETQSIEVNSLLASSGGRQEQAATILFSGRAAKVPAQHTSSRNLQVRHCP